MKQKKSCIKNILIKLISCVMVSLLVITVPVIQKKEDYFVYAEATPTAKASFITWLMSYFGINVYTDGAEIADDLYTAVKLAYEAYLATQQPSNQYAFDDLFDGITYTPSQPNALRLSGWVFNALKGFATWMNSVNTSEEIGEYEGFEIGTYEIQGNLNYYVPITPMNVVKRSDTNRIAQFQVDNPNMRVVYFKCTDSYAGGIYYGVALPSTDTGAKTFRWLNPYNNSWVNNTLNYTYDGYYLYSQVLVSTNYIGELYVDYAFTTAATSTSSNKNNIISYTFGSNAGQAGTLSDVYALPNPAVLDDLIGAVDPEDDVTIDLDGSDLAVGTLATLEDLINAVNDLVDTYVVDNSYPETIGKVIAQGLEIVNEITEVEYPDAINWQVPEIIDTPQIIPLITPECPDLSSCLISGVQEVSNTMNEIINVHPDTGNYVTAALYMGLVLLILGSTVL